MNEQHIDTSEQAALCHVCRKPALDVVPGYELLSQVTSDCKPWQAGAKLCLCRSCGAVQKLVDQKWLCETETIYSHYSIYHQGEGSEQQVFEKDSGLASSRSAKLLKCALPHLRLPQTGRLLDVGCGNGALLRSFQQLVLHWQLAGTELNDKYRAEIESIAGSPALFTCALDEISETFDMISMLHVLEHIIDPLGFLAEVKDKLAPDGILLIDLPDYLYNPFDLLIADHCSHFSTQTLQHILACAGFEIVTITTEWIPKELSVIAKKSKRPAEPREVGLNTDADSLPMLQKRVNWLQSIACSARTLSKRGNFGIFGTSIAGTWLNEEAKGADFFVDEDTNRIGHDYLGKPVYHPADVPEGCSIFLAQPPGVAKDIRGRLAMLRPDIHFCLPPDID